MTPLRVPQPSLCADLSLCSADRRDGGDTGRESVGMRGEGCVCVCGMCVGGAALSLHIPRPGSSSFCLSVSLPLSMLLSNGSPGSANVGHLNLYRPRIYIHMHIYI